MGLAGCGDVAGPRRVTREIHVRPSNGRTLDAGFSPGCPGMTAEHDGSEG